MIEILNKIESWEIVTVSPLQHPITMMFSIVMVIFFTEATLKVFRHLKKGMTLVGPKPIPFPIEIKPGHVDISSSGKISVYKDSPRTALIGMTLYFIVHFMIFIAFKAVEFKFKI